MRQAVDPLQALLLRLHVSSLRMLKLWVCVPAASIKYLHSEVSRSDVHMLCAACICDGDAQPWLLHVAATMHHITPRHATPHHTTPHHTTPHHTTPEHRLPPGQDPSSPQAGEPGPLGTATPRRPSVSTDHRLGGTPVPPGLVSLGCWELLPPAGPPWALTTAWVGLPVRLGW